MAHLATPGGYVGPTREDVEEYRRIQRSATKSQILIELIKVLDPTDQDRRHRLCDKVEAIADEI